MKTDAELQSELSSAFSKACAAAFLFGVGVCVTIGAFIAANGWAS